MKRWDYPLGKRATNLNYTADGVAAKFGCRVWLDWNGEGEGRRCVLRFLGPIEHKEKVNTLLDLLDKQMHIEWEGYRQDRQREKHWDLRHTHLRASWERGFCERIGERLANGSRQSKALEAAVAASMQRLDLNLVAFRSHARQFPEAYTAGVAAADKMSLRSLAAAQRSRGGSNE